MEVDWGSLYSKQGNRIQASYVRMLLSLTRRTRVRSMGGGFPPNIILPRDLSKELLVKVIEEEPNALQYGTTEGEGKYLEAVIELKKRSEGVVVRPDQVQTVTGAQQALFSIAVLLTDEKTYMIVESPYYLGLVNCLKLTGCQVVPIPMDKEGIRVDLARGAVRRLRAEGKKVAGIDVNPTFQNPTGQTMSLPRRVDLLEVSEEFGVPIFSDEPYWELRFEGEYIPTLLALSSQCCLGTVVQLETFSKTLCPGLRLGFMVGPQEFIAKVCLLKQSLDLNTSTLVQYLAAALINHPGFWDEHIAEVIRVCRERRDRALSSFEKYLAGKMAWNVPEGGLFIWGEFDEKVDADELAGRALKRDVGIVPGRAFNGPANTARFNFTYENEEVFEAATKDLSAEL